MGDSTAREARCAVIVGPYTAGKTTLLEAMLFTAGAIQRKGSVPQKTTVGDASAEARQRQMTTDPNIVHFSYLGDANIGEETNIGAGTVTANFDRATHSKHRTNIGKGAFIGVDTMIVAPREIGDGAATGGCGGM